MVNDSQLEHISEKKTMKEKRLYASNVFNTIHESHKLIIYLQNTPPKTAVQLSLFYGAF